MKRAYIRSTIFNVTFILWSLLCCILYIPTFFFPRPLFIKAVKAYLHSIAFLERTILNLHYEVKGKENLPKDGSYIIAAKHQSTYETLKLHLLFNDPAVILKRELLNIPFWGQYLKKADVIAIDRSSPDAAIQSIQDGAKRMMAQNRPIIIFPQGTRVRPDQTATDKPYKVGIARIQEATNLPIIPLALNTGAFWPRTGWGKSSGKITFEILPPIKPGLERSALLSQLENTIEKHSNTLTDQALQRNKDRKQNTLRTLALTLLIALPLLYTALWFKASNIIQTAYPNILKDHQQIMRTPSSIKVTGFPGPLKIQIPEEYLEAKTGQMTLNDIHITAWLLPLIPAKIKTSTIQIKDNKWPNPLIFDGASGRLTYNGKTISILDSLITKDTFNAQITGTIQPHEKPINIQATLQMHDHESLINTLKSSYILSSRMTLWANAGLSTFKKNNTIEIPLNSHKNTLYLGPLKLIKLGNSTAGNRQRQSLTPIPDPDAPE